MLTCQLTKLESALDQVKKTYPKLKPADAALLASALSLTGRHAIAIYDGEQYVWPNDNDKMMRALLPQLEMVQDGIDEQKPKRGSKSAVEEEPVNVGVGLKPNLTAGEAILEGRDELKAKLSDILQDGVEFAYTGTDIGWQWALDRANFTTYGDREFSKRIKIRASFTEGAIGIELGTATPKKKRAPAKKKDEADGEAEAESAE